MAGEVGQQETATTSTDEAEAEILAEAATDQPPNATRLVQLH